VLLLSLNPSLPLTFFFLSKIAQSLEWVAFRIQIWNFFYLINFRVGKFIFFGRKKNRMKKFICSKRNKLEWEKSIESGGGELHT
jgi:hypothetical protein